MNRTKHAYCSTTVFSTWQLKRAFTHFLQYCPHVLQNRLLKLKKVFILLSFYTLQTVPLRLKTSFFSVFTVSLIHEKLLMSSKVQDVRALQINTENNSAKIKKKQNKIIVLNTQYTYAFECDICELLEK